ncbi:AAA domain-containing protein [Aliivibrio fischeri]|uniref:AAA family ATPase n=1 Tax=Aliivibrio fischeri TaxID=668 RepID=UPI0012DA8B0D|nr:AAA family ATPase [Aliivibrio fischeri]MUK93525.1 AAA domain-containing protein [Aliivibrio fischeri]
MNDLKAVWDEFLSRWSKEKVEQLTLEEYIDVNNKDTLAYWLEHKTKSLGSIRGGDSSKFGIYRRNRPPRGERSHIKHGEVYSWVTRFGDTEEKAFAQVKNSILQVINCIEIGDIKTIQTIELADTLKWKIAFLYQDANNPKVINIFKRDMLRDACLDPTGDFSDLYKDLLKKRGDKHILQYGYEIWNSLEKEELDNFDISAEHYYENLSEEGIVPNTLNTILYGPPGTGKTYTTINKALQIVAPDFYLKNKDDREKLKCRFDELLNNNRIGFVTFHQSFSYEDFVEGLKASTTEGKQISYDVEDGIFKSMCNSASVKATVNTEQQALDISNRKIWKMSLGDTSGEDAFIYQQCIENNYVLLGYGYDIDFSNTSNRKEVIETFRTNEVIIDKESSDYRVTSVNNFKNEMSIGDLVVISDGNRKFRAIAEITSDYIFDETLVSDSGYSQVRKVTWHRVYEPSLPVDELFKKNLSQMTLYRLYGATIDLDKLQGIFSLPSIEDKTEISNDRVLIIDEINRGNISNIFGELITLIEPSKRSGGTESLSVKLPYSKETFSVPSNLHIIGTMNTADKSLAQLDIALRRRFEFVEMMTNYELLKDIPNIEGINVAKLVKTMNQRIELLYDREHTIGHSFFLPLLGNPSLQLLAEIFELQILPLLEEYFFEDWERVGQVLGDHLKDNHELRFVIEQFGNSEIAELMGDDWEVPGIQSYCRNQKAFKNPQAYIGVYTR